MPDQRGEGGARVGSAVASDTDVQGGRSAGRGQQWRKIQAVIAGVVAGRHLLLSSRRRGARAVRIRMRHRSELGEQQRKRGHQRDAESKTIMQLDQRHDHRGNVGSMLAP